MILIISNDFDQSTNDVMKWLKYYNQKIIRVNNNCELPNFEITIGEKHLVKVNPNSKDALTGIWYRNKPTYNSSFSTLEAFDHKAKQQFADYLKNELSVLYSAFSTSGINVLGSSDLIDINKITVLKCAKDVGFNIPASVITNTKEELIKFYNCKKPVIVKPLTNSLTFINNKNRYFLYTELLTFEKIQESPETFFPTLIQEYIEKQIELRVFFIDGKKFCMAIFSQQSDKTKIDSRKYDASYSCRNVPFNLPSEIEKKIDLLMETLRLNTGSLDLIYSTSGDYYFLEVNPFGQFGNVSYNCNFFLEKEIANYLTKKNGER